MKRSMMPSRVPVRVVRRVSSNLETFGTSKPLLFLEVHTGKAVKRDGSISVHNIANLFVSIRLAAKLIDKSVCKASDIVIMTRYEDQYHYYQVGVTRKSQ